MSTQHIYFAHAITTNKALVNPLGLALDPDPNATDAFPTALILAGSGHTTADAWFSAVSLKANAYGNVQAFMAGGYPQVFIDAGATVPYMDAARAALTVEVGPRSELEGNGMAFITAHGYEVMPP